MFVKEGYLNPIWNHKSAKTIIAKDALDGAK